MYNKIIVIIPAFNEDATIEEVIGSVKPYANEIIVVDDGSSDSTSLKAKEAGAVVVRNEKNSGYESAIESGFKKALQGGADVFVTFDADGQHNAEDIKKMADLIINGKADLVLGQRPRRFVHFSERIFAFYTNMRFGIKDPLCGLKAYSVKVYQDVGYFDRIGSIGTQLMIQAKMRNFKLLTIPVYVNPRKDSSRFYFKNLKANYKIFLALLKTILYSAKLV